MLQASDLHGVMAMMPAFATANAADVRARETVDVASLQVGVDKIIRDGANVIATTGSFGEFHTLLEDEWQTIVRASIEAVNGRVPLFLGCTSLNSREVVRRMEIIRDAGGQGVLVGVPFYFPSTVDNAVRFYLEIADMFPTLAIMVYHNPVLHRITIPEAAFRRLVEKPNIVGLKDSHRDTRQFMRLDRIIRGKISAFVHATQAYPFYEMGAAGFWSYDIWMGPEPMLRLRDAMEEHDEATVKAIIFDLMQRSVGGVTQPDLTWRETASKLAIQDAGYVNVGPLRPPFVEIPADVREKARQYAEFWRELCDRYRPAVEARRASLAGV